MLSWSYLSVSLVLRNIHWNKNSREPVVRIKWDNACGKTGIYLFIYSRSIPWAATRGWKNSQASIWGRLRHSPTLGTSRSEDASIPVQLEPEAFQRVISSPLGFSSSVLGWQLVQPIVLPFPENKSLGSPEPQHGSLCLKALLSPASGVQLSVFTELFPAAKQMETYLHFQWGIQ